MSDNRKQHECYSYERFQKDLSTIHASEELKYKTKNYISKKAQSKTSFPRLSLTFAPVLVSLCLFLMLGSGAFVSYRIPVTTVSVDVNPSLELKVNTWDYVVDVVTYNEDAQTITKHLALTNKRTNHALDTLLSASSFAKYLKVDSDLTLTIVSKDGENYTKQLTNHFLQSGTADMVIKLSDKDTLKEAHEHHFSVGKYHAYKELASFDDSIEMEDCRHMTMHEIHNAILNHCNDDKLNEDKNLDTEKNLDKNKHKVEHETTSEQHKHSHH